MPVNARLVQLTFNGEREPPLNEVSPYIDSYEGGEKIIQAVHKSQARSTLHMFSGEPINNAAADMYGGDRGKCGGSDNEELL
ncbi:hypothetical protein [Bacillus sp. FJAT-27251]|uniref:hypothetical protein n=1 Tax=Bacillus sp. FJAT-27251 TaxID=1684142 RepID=UPI0006A77BC5|nr:hypothetical protein [Bacillus sp. FJAT-27251]